jgi:excisionase family DNA binding protein
MTEQLLTVEQAAAYLQISKRTLFRLIKDGKIRALRVGNSYRFRQNDLDEDIKINK